MAIGGGGVPSIRAELVDGKLVLRGMQVNKPRTLVIQDAAEALRLLKLGGQVTIHAVGLPQKLTEMLSAE